MRRLSMALGALVLVGCAAPAFAAETASPVFNGRFELFAPGARTLERTPLGGEGLGVGHQAFCTGTAMLAWGADCDGDAVDRVAMANDLAAHPWTGAREEIAMWREQGYHENDVGVVAPAKNNLWHASGWMTYPFDGVAFGDFDESGDREAQFLETSALLYQNYGATSTHMVVPMGAVQAISFRLESGSPGGMVRLLLDSFPTESATDYPLLFYNYQLVLPTFTWQRAGNMIHIDPADGVLLGPSASSYAVADADTHPDASRWASATKDERREILMELRAIQVGFQSLDAGAIVDDVQMTLVVEEAPAEDGAETLSQAAAS